MIKTDKICVAVGLLELILLLGSVSASAQPSLLGQIMDSQEAIVEVTAENVNIYKAEPQIAGFDRRTGHVVTVQNYAQSAYERKGAGVIIHPEGVIVTNAHIIHMADRIKITLFDKTEVYASIVKYLNPLDFALLKIDPPFPLSAVVIADSDKLNLGEDIITVGNSFILNGTVSGGNIKGIGSHTTHSGNSIDLIQTTINLYEGDSGGPLFDSRGRLIGLMTAKERGTGRSSFAIPSNNIKKMLLEYLHEQSR